MAKKQIVVDIAEITSVRLTCSNDQCGAVLELPLPLRGNPTGCSACNQRRAVGINSVDVFLDSLEKARDSGIQFVIPDIPSSN